MEIELWTGGVTERSTVDQAPRRRPTLNPNNAPARPNTTGTDQAVLAKRRSSLRPSANNPAARIQNATARIA